MVRFEIAVEGANEAANAAGDLAERMRRSPRPLLADIARQWAEEVFPAVFDRGGDPLWEPLSPVSVKLRGSAKPLQGEGILRRSFQVLGISDAEAEVGSEIGAIHQLGGRTSPRSMIPDAEIPARPFLILDDSAIDRSAEQISDFYFGGIP